MQITINQTEIETAIRNHVLGLIAVRENMRIDIDLKATRKEDGYTAIIDIYPDDTPEGGEPIETPAPVFKKAPPVEAKPEPKAEAPKAVVEAEAAPVVEVVETSKEEPVTEEVAVAPAKKTTTRGLFKKEAAEPKEEAPAVAANESGEAPRSIFASLKKPVNTPALEADAA